MSTQKKTGMPGWLIAVVVVLLVAAGWWLMNQKPAQSQPLAAMDTVPAAVGSQATH